MYISLVIGFYKRLDTLNLIFQGLQKQSYTDFEVIIAEDDENDATKVYLDQMRRENHFPIKHVSHPDIGFRKNKALNEAIRVSSGKLVVFIDGDCIPHKHFLYQYAKQYEPFTMLYGRRVMLSNTLTNTLLTTGDLSHINLLKLYTSKSTIIEEGFYLPFDFLTRRRFKSLLGSNWGISKQTLLDVNGFDEDYVRAGVGEDTDIEWRLVKLGVKSKSLKFKCIQYHLDHKIHYFYEELMLNFNMMEEKKKLGFVRCKNGIEKLV